MTEQVTLRLCGVISEPPGFAVPLDSWTGCSNYVARAGVMQRKDFASDTDAIAVFPTVGVWAAPVASFAGPSGSILLFGADTTAGSGTTVAKVYTTTLGAETDRTPGGWSGAARTNYYTAGRLNDGCWFLNASGEPPVYWSGAACAVLPNWLGGGWQTRCMRAHREFLLALNIYNALAGNFEPDSVYWSDAAWTGAGVGPPGTWIAAAGNLAGNLFLPGRGGPIVDGRSLRDSFFVYKNQAVWKLERVDNNAVFASTPVFDGFGAADTNHVASDGSKHYVFTGKDVIAHDGNEYISLVTRKNRSYLQAQGSLIGRGGFTFYDQTRHELWVCFPTGSGAHSDVALVIDTLSGHQSFLTPPGGPGIRFMVPNDPLAATPGIYALDHLNGRIIAMESGSTNDAGIAIATSLTRTGLDLGDPERQKKIRWVRPRLNPTGGAVTMSVEVAMTNTPDDAPSYGTAITFSTATSDRAFFDQQVGRYAAVRLTTSATQPMHTVEGFDVGFDPAGLY